MVDKSYTRLDRLPVTRALRRHQAETLWLCGLTVCISPISQPPKGTIDFEFDSDKNVYVGLDADGIVTYTLYPLDPLQYAMPVLERFRKSNNSSRPLEFGHPNSGGERKDWSKVPRELKKEYARQGIVFKSCAIKRISQLYNKEMAEFILQKDPSSSECADSYRFYLDEYKHHNEYRYGATLKQSWDSFVKLSVTEQEFNEDHFVWVLVGEKVDVNSIKK